MIFPFNAGEVFKMALQIEENGQSFYEKAAARPFPEMIQKLFRDLAKEETGHRALFQSILDKLPPSTTKSSVWDPAGELDQYLKLMASQHVFNRTGAELEEMLAKVEGAVSAVRMAMGFEKDTIVFFLEMMEASDSDESRAFIGRLVNEERGHLKRLADILTKLIKD